VKLRVRAASLGELAAEAGRALCELHLGARAPAAAGEWRELEVRAADREALLVDWLNELIYLAEAEHWVAVEFRVRDATDTVLAIEARGIVVDEAPARVKAATFHGLHIAPSPAGFEVEIVFDV